MLSFIYIYFLKLIGYGAPREGKGPQKENLMKILHYPSAKSPSNVELITLERLPVHKA